MEANLFAYIALLTWPFFSLLLYRSLPLGQATLWTILGAELLLPVGAAIKFPGVPPLDKTSVSTLSALAGCVLLAPRSRLRGRGGSRLVNMLLVLYFVVPFVTSMLNREAIFVGPRILPGVGMYDATSQCMEQLLVFLPYILARRYLKEASDVKGILRILVIAGIIYSIPMLFEARFSPQLHTWIYGYFPHLFYQQMRGDGFRPVVFMGHGLLVAFFSATTVIAAAALWRTRKTGRLPAAGVTAYLAVLLVLTKSAGALVYAVFLVPLVRFAGPRWQARVAVVLVTIAVCYPAMRLFEVFPTAALTEIAQSFSSERADSLQFRFDNEDMLLERASERLWFGWGRFGRNRIYDDNGNDAAVTDGRWIITLGRFGLLGFIAEFGLLALSVLLAASALKRAASREEAIHVAALALVCAIVLVEQLPNASLDPWMWLLAGALLGKAESLRAGKTRHAPTSSLGGANGEVWPAAQVG